MQHHRYILGVLAFSLSSLLAPVSASANAKIIAHEWGTFTSLVGSNGVPQAGMYHEDEALPHFVHNFGELAGSTPTSPQDPNCQKFSKVPCNFLDHNAVLQKMETPVIYFYSPVQLAVNVDVHFPLGVVAETYPGPSFTAPDKNSAPIIANGHTIFDVTVEPLHDTESLRQSLPAVPAGNIYGHARGVHSSIVETGQEKEQFIFYRGLGTFLPSVEAFSQNGFLRLRTDNDEIPAAFLVDVDQQGDARLLMLGGITYVSKTIDSAHIKLLRDHSVPSKSVVSGDQIHSVLSSSLENAGLFADEAEAMVNTWENGYFHVPGLRLLYILPRSEVESILPLTITPEPMDLERIFVGRVEVLLDSDESALLEQVKQLRDYMDVAQLGRFAESILRRVKEVYVEHQQAAGATVDNSLMSVFDRLISRAEVANPPPSLN